MLNCLIIEDEQDAQEIVKGYIDKTNHLQLLGIFESGLDVPKELLQQSDLIFLDIQLPGLNGMQYLKSLDQPPAVIITTAYPNFAIEAFDIAVTDYLLKPFSFERFYKAVNRVHKESLATNKKEETFFVYANKTNFKIKSSDILYLKAEVDYVNIKTVKQDILVLDSLRNWKEKLADSNFMQIHRSYIANMEKVEKVSGSQLHLSNTECLPIGVTFKERVLKKFFE